MPGGHGAIAQWNGQALEFFSTAGDTSISAP
jgi:hypothetical protein